MTTKQLLGSLPLLPLVVGTPSGYRAQHLCTVIVMYHLDFHPEARKLEERLQNPYIPADSLKGRVNRYKI